MDAEATAGIDAAAPIATEETRPHGAVRDVVIVGGGFAGLACAKALGGARKSDGGPVRVVLIDKQNYHLFQPLLYQVATAALSPADIAEPIRKILSRHDNIDVVMGEVTGIDTAGHLVSLASGTSFRYGTLVLATGSEYNYFGHDDWARHAPGLKTIENAREIRSRILANFEEAETCTDPARQRELMTSVVIGGGPTGVEMAGAIAELARWTLARDFRHIDPRSARVILVEAGPRILSAVPEELGDYARRILDSLGVEIRTGTAVEDVTETGVTMGGQFVGAGSIVWGAGIRPTAPAGWLGGRTERGKVEVAPDLAVVGVPDVFALGDIAALKQDGKPLPALAQVAKQQGEHLGAALKARFAAGTPVPPFHFADRGNTAVIGRHAAVFDFGRRRLKGRLAWFLWALVHVYLLVGFQKRILVTLQWIWRYFTYQRGARIIR